MTVTQASGCGRRAFHAPASEATVTMPWAQTKRMTAAPGELL